MTDSLSVPLPPAAVPIPPKSFLVTWLLSLLLGGIGADRIYIGKVGTGILKFLTAGGFGAWVIIDLVLILSGAMRDGDGRPLVGYDLHKKVAWIVSGSVGAVLLAAAIAHYLLVGQV